IVSYLNPNNLVLFACTNWSIRKRLLTRSMASVWRNALARIKGLPPCPTHMTEPAYAALIYSPWCSVNTFNHTQSNIL
ncbi:hypothetical protein BDV93DRAFT_438725, partial [Ceratobasidium sp. AG-I]